MTDSNGVEINIGDKVYGVGYLHCQDGFKIDLSPTVTVREKDGVIYFGGLSMSSFRRFYKYDKNSYVKHTKFDF